MFRAACVFLVPLFLLLGCSNAGKDTARAQPPPAQGTSTPVAKDLILGFDHCSPAVFFRPQRETTVTISEIVYDKAGVGMLSSFKEEIVSDKLAPAVVKVNVNLAKWNGTCSSLEYTVDTAGKRLSSPKYDAFDGSTGEHAVAFSAEEPLSIILGGGPLEADLSTELAYDAKGRQSIKRQAFAYGGMNYEVSYSDHSYFGPPTGKVSSYTAHISAKRK